MTRFDPELFVEACRDALSGTDPLDALHAAVTAALRDRETLLARVPTDRGMFVSVLHESKKLTVLQFVTPKGFAFPPHNHAMVSAVGVYLGAEDNVYYTHDGTSLRETERRTVATGQVAVHDRDVVHAIAAAGSEPLGALHVYGGDFFHEPRSEWRGTPLERHEYDTARLRALAASGR